MPVVLSHAAVPGFAGGFVGVDIFFVISGFLITGILIREVEAGGLSLTGFYERRARRILPALFAMVATCIVAGWFILSPDGYSDLARSVLATLLFVSNFWFWHVTGDYFGASAHIQPLMHTWSLAVEEQFYLAFPLLLWVLASRGRQTIRAVVLGLSLLSFGLSVWMTSAAPDANFFLAPTRVWELGLGALLALGAFPRVRGGAVTEGIAAAGLAMILASIVLLSAEVPFPGLAAAPVCLGAIALIWAGPTTRVGRLLSQPVPVFFGLISYSLYLWHWPLLVAARLAGGTIHAAPLATAAAIIAAVILATLSWRFVERPFRRPPAAGGPSRRTVFRLSGAGAAVLAALAVAIPLNDGFGTRLPPDVIAEYRTARIISDLDTRCRAGDPSEHLCVIGARANAGAPDEGAATIMVWGDSHAGAALPGIDAWLAARGLDGVAAIKSACPPLLGVQRKDREPGHGCDRFNADVIGYLQDHPNIETVILGGRWALASGDAGIDGGAPSPSTLRLAQDAQAEMPEADIFGYALNATIDQLHAMGHDIILVEGVPELEYPVPEAFLGSAMIGSPIPTRSHAQFDQRNARVTKALDQLDPDTPIRRTSMADLMCPQDACATSEDGHLLYRDDHHLTEFAAKHYVPMALDRLYTD